MGAVENVCELNEPASSGGLVHLVRSEELRAVEVVLLGNDGLGLSLHLGIGIADAAREV